MGSKITPDVGLLAYRELDEKLRLMSIAAGYLTVTKTRRIILDMDSSVSKAHGGQECAKYNRHFE